MTTHTAAWIGIAIAFVRGLFVFDMGPSAADSNPVASAICLAAAVLGTAILARHRERPHEPSE